MSERIDITFDFRRDTPLNGDPDALSPTLRRYHKVLWGRTLPDGRDFQLDASGPIRARYLYHRSELGEFHLSSDSVAPTFTRWKRMAHIINQIPEEENEAFRSFTYTIGAMMIWPRVASEYSINAARGTNASISDRMDLTVECIRRFYEGLESPLHRVLVANARFFDLFGDFKGFIDHFLLQDLVSADYTETRFFMPFDDFKGPARPVDLPQYLSYKEKTTGFVRSRNERIFELSLTL